MWMLWAVVTFILLLASLAGYLVALSLLLFGLFEPQPATFIRAVLALAIGISAVKLAKNVSELWVGKPDV